MWFSQYLTKYDVYNIKYTNMEVSIVTLPAKASMNVKLGNHTCMVRPNMCNLMEKWWIFASFSNFSKSKAFVENFIRTKFILHKKCFLMSIFSSRKISLMFFNLCWKNCEKPFVGGHNHFEGKGASGDKNQYELFCKKWGFKYFSYNIFSKEKKEQYSLK